MNKPTVFISYSHLDEEWKDRLVRHLAVSQKQGHLKLWHDRMIGAGEDWERQIQAAMDAASVAILLVSANSLTSDFILREEVSRLLERRASEGLRIFPVVIKPCDWGAVDWLRRMNLRPKDGKPLSGGNEHEIDQAFTEIAREIRELLKQTAPTITPTFVPLNPDGVSISRLPSLLTPHLFGREAELQLLDKAWANPATNVVTFVAWGGVGKTALVNHWVRRLAERNYDGARVYAWSFYSQGTSDDRAATAEYFIDAALRWFGDPDPAAGSPWDKGERLARLIRAQRTLLVLDGLEPLQQPPNEIGLIEGRLKEQSMQALLRELAAGQSGLCVISTRVPVAELEDYESAALRYDLDQLAPEAGAQLLRKLGVTGEDDELEQAAKEFGGHSLALTLLGAYLNEVFGGDVRRRHEIESLTADAQHGGHARRVMTSYEKWLGDGPELAVLRLLGLFDRPADAASIAALRAAPAIPGLTDAFFNVKRQPRWFGLSTVEKAEPISDEKWRQTLAKLRRIKLLAERPAQASREAEEELGAHPLVREHFRVKLKAERPDAWSAGNLRLYEHLTRTAKEFPDTLEEMEPLYAAVTHGCAAGMYQEVLLDVYWRRILRGEKHFSWKKLGAVGPEFAMLKGFFATPWQQTVAGLTKEAKAFVLGQAGLFLRAQGRLNEAAQSMQAGLDDYLSQESPENAAILAGNLSELYMTTGDVPNALTHAQQGMELADRSGNSDQRIILRTTLADALHQAGNLNKAEQMFHEAEAMQKMAQPGYPFLYSLAGFQYYDLLLEQGNYQEVQNRVARALKIVKQHYGLLDIALDQLALGRAWLLQAVQPGSLSATPSATQADTDSEPDALAQAVPLLDLAVAGLWEAGAQHHIPRGLLARAAYLRWVRRYDEAQRDLDEALRIATRGLMRLHQADCHLESARLSLATGDRATARKAWETAKAMIEKMGYHRRDGEVAEIEAQLNADGG